MRWVPWLVLPEGGHAREGDAACRPGGEEFLLVLGGVGLDEATAVAERIRRATELASRRAGVPFTASLGVATRSLHGDGAEDLLRAADRALYAAKESGRNRVCQPAPPEPVRRSA